MAEGTELPVVRGVMAGGTAIIVHHELISARHCLMHLIFLHLAAAIMMSHIPCYHVILSMESSISDVDWAEPAATAAVGPDASAGDGAWGMGG